MQGINILNQTEIMTYSNFNGGIILISFIGLIVCVIIAFDNCDEWISTMLGCIFGIIFALFVIIGETEPTGRYRYECIIDKSVSIQDIYDNYKVVEQRGELWILEDKEEK